MTSVAPTHSKAFLARRFLNWFPLGVAYAMLYMGRYNLTVAKNALGELMTKEDFGIIFGAGTVVYAISFLVNGPLVDRLGGRRGMLVSLFGAGVANILMGVYLASVLASGNAADAPLRLVFSLLYAVNMYFQSFGAVSIVKVNAHWFHVKERGGFSGIFGTMISSGIFLAFTVNGVILDFARATWPDQKTQWVVFAAPAVLLLVIWVVELFLLRDRPAQAGHEDFDTGDASSGEDEQPIPTMQLFKRLLTNPIIITVGLIEFCTGVLRNGVMHWFPIYAKEVWVLDSTHPLVRGSFSLWTLALAVFVGVALNVAIARFAQGTAKRVGITVVSLAALTPFFFAGWGGILFVAGVVGGNVAGWVSDLFFQSRRGPAAFFLYAMLAVCTAGMAFALAPSTNVVATAAEGSGLQAGDEVVEIAGKKIEGWQDVVPAVACVVPTCVASAWDAEACMCTTAALQAGAPTTTAAGTIAAKVKRGGQIVDVQLKDPSPSQKAGDKRALKASPVLPMSPWVLGLLVFFMSLAVIGTHGLLSGTATMDFGGRKAAGTAVGVIDGFVYLGTALQSVVLGYLTSEDWSYWPWFLFPFAVLGTVLLTRIWHAAPKKGGGGH